MPRKNPTRDEAPTLGRRVCGTCQHWERFPDDGHPADPDPHGECLLHPPKVHGCDDEGTPIQSLPVVAYGHRCAQHTYPVN